MDNYVIDLDVDAVVEIKIQAESPEMACVYAGEMLQGPDVRIEVLEVLKVKSIRNIEKK